MAIKTDGSLWAWGWNYYGQIGDGTTTDRHSPVKIMDNVASVSAGQNYSLAIKTDGSLWAWGMNRYHGLLGDGTTTDRHSPVKIMDNVASISAGYHHTFAIKTDRSLWVWGSNIDGLLGDGTTTDRHSPVKIMDNVASVSAGYLYSLVIKTDKSLWAWGYNGNGQLGNGTTTYQFIPIKTMENVASVSAGRFYSLVVKTDESLWACGDNYYGQLGDGTTTERRSPVKIMNNVSSVSAGGTHSLAIKTDGSLWAWGRNWAGQLGDGTTINRPSPVRVYFPDTVTTNAATDKTTSGATLNGNFNFSDGIEVEDHGFYWGTSDTSQTEMISLGSKTANGEFSSILSGRPEGVRIYFKAYARSSDGAMFYGNVLNFTTLITQTKPVVTTKKETDVTATTATLNGKLEKNGGTAVKDSGFYWGTSSASLTNEVSYGPLGTPDNLYPEFSMSVSGLPSDTTIYFQAYAKNDTGEGVGDILNFKTGVTGSSLEVNTFDATAKTSNSALLHGSVPAWKDDPIGTYGFEYGTDFYLDSDKTKVVVRASNMTRGSGIFSHKIENLQNGIKYYFRAYAYDGVNEKPQYGEIRSFTTGAETLPTSLTFEKTSYSAEIPLAGENTLSVSAIVKDQYGNPMPELQSGIQYSIDGVAYTGVSVTTNSTKGVGNVVVSSKAAEGQAKLKATYGTLTPASANLVLTKDVRVTVNIYGDKDIASENYYRGIAGDAAYSFKETFKIDMQIFFNNLDIESKRKIVCISHNSQFCLWEDYGHNYYYYFEPELSEYLRSNSTNRNGLHTLFFDGYLSTGCKDYADDLGCVNPSKKNNALITSKTLWSETSKSYAFPFRVAQHEWSHNYGIEFDPYAFVCKSCDEGKSHPLEGCKKCKGKYDDRCTMVGGVCQYHTPCKTACIMMGYYSSEKNPRSNVWCRRCESLIDIKRW